MLNSRESESNVRVEELSGFSKVAMFEMKHISIENHILVGANTSIWDASFQELDAVERRYGSTQNTIVISPAHIVGNVFVVTECLILWGVTIGNKAAFKVGSVMIKSIFPEKIFTRNQTGQTR